MITGNGFDAEFASPAEWARFYRSITLQVVPAFMPGESKGSWKRPLLKAWTQYQDILVTDEVFEPWYGPTGQYRQRPNMGVITGKASGNLFVIDLDIHKKPEALHWWLNLMELHNSRLELETVEQRTGGGGLQKLYHAPVGWTPPTCKTAIGIDIRGQGGFAMLCPSMHESGHAYEWLEGHSPDEIEITMAPEWLLEALDALVCEHGGGTGGAAPRARAPAGEDYDGFGYQTDGREDKMYRMVFRCVVNWYRACPIKPGDAESARKAGHEYETYERGVNPQRPHPADLNKTQKLDREGRGWETWWTKWQYAMRQWEDKIHDEAAKPDPRPDEPPGYKDFTEEYAKTKAPGDLYELLDVDQILSMPDPRWLVDKLVVEEALGFIYGPPGCLKTFIALDLALSFTSGRPSWWNRPIQRQGAVIYISSEGLADLKFRLQAWEHHRGTKINGTPFYLVRQSINFMNSDDVQKLLRTVQSVADKVPVAAVFVDTVSRVLPGAEENLQKDMTLFIAACDAVRQLFKTTVFGIHHTSRNGNMRGSTVMPGAGDFIVEVRREPGAMTGSIFAFKIKAAEDGWEQNFTVNKIDLPGIVPRVSLVVDPIEHKPKTEHKSSWPDTSVCREILAAIDEHWWKKVPWCYAVNSSRSAIINIMKKWRLERSVAKDILATWTAEGMIEEVEYDSKMHAKGYRKVFGF